MPEESTTPDLVELVRAAFEAGDRRDHDTLMSFYAPNAVMDLSDLGLGTYEGVDAIRAFVEDFVFTYEAYESTADEILRLGESVVLTVNTQMGRLPGTSEFVRLHDAYVLLFEDGLLVRWTAYRDIGEGRAAAERLAESRR
jgi:ketosteroid isomerase-like protein